MPSTSRNSERYPRYDRGLGMVLTSEGHRRTVCKEKGLIPIEGDWEVPPSIRDQWAASDALVAEHESTMKMYNESPDFAEYRKARDTGQLQIALEPDNAATPGVA